MRVEVNIVNAFSYHKMGGNKAGVVLDADLLSPAQKQEVARRAGLTETAFVSKSALAGFKLDFFTPERQIAHCGHATIASFTFLREKGIIANTSISSKETIDGIREIRFIGGQVYMEQKAPVFSSPTQNVTKQILHSLGLQEIAGKPPIFVNTGNTFMLLEVENEERLKALKPHFEKIREISLSNDLVGYYIFCRPLSGAFDASARMFAPSYGIEEESATGMAAGPLASWLFNYGRKQSEYRIAQGNFMDEPSPSLINVKMKLAGGQIAALFAGGEATLSGTEEFEIAGCDEE